MRVTPSKPTDPYPTRNYDTEACFFVTDTILQSASLHVSNTYPAVSPLDQTGGQPHRGRRRCGPGRRFVGEHNAGLSRVSASGHTQYGQSVA